MTDDKTTLRMERTYRAPAQVWVVMRGGKAFDNLERALATA
jgi:hypothetical protein